MFVSLMGHLKLDALGSGWKELIKLFLPLSWSKILKVTIWRKGQSSRASESPGITVKNTGVCSFPCTEQDKPIIKQEKLQERMWW